MTPVSLLSRLMRNSPRNLTPLISSGYPYWNNMFIFVHLMRFVNITALSLIARAGSSLKEKQYQSFSPFLIVQSINRRVSVTVLFVYSTRHTSLAPFVHILWWNHTHTHASRGTDQTSYVYEQHGVGVRCRGDTLNAVRCCNWHSSWRHKDRRQNSACVRVEGYAWR